MKNSVFKLLVFAGIVTILTGCPGLLFTYGDDIVLQNRTSSCIRCYETSFSKEYKKSYKDTAIHFSPESGLLEIQGGSFFINNTFAHTLEEFFEGIPCDTLMFFILDSTTVADEPWEEIVKGYKILRRYDLSIEDMMKLIQDDGTGYTIPYPPTVAMKDMHMFPPYGEGSNRYD